MPGGWGAPGGHEPWLTPRMQHMQPPKRRQPHWTVRVQQLNGVPAAVGTCGAKSGSDLHIERANLVRFRAKTFPTRPRLPRMWNSRSAVDVCATGVAEMAHNGVTASERHKIAARSRPRRGSPPGLWTLVHFVLLLMCRYPDIQGHGLTWRQAGSSSGPVPAAARGQRAQTVARGLCRGATCSASASARPS